MSSDDVLKMNPADGTKLGLKAGDMVKVTSPTGAGPAGAAGPG